VHTTIKLPDDLIRQLETAAVSRGQTLDAFVCEALTMRLATMHQTSPPGWRGVFGVIEPKIVKRIDATLAAAFERVDLAAWR